MSWEPAWGSDGRGGHARNPQRPEVEREEPPPPPSGGGDDEEEGEISAGGGMNRPNEKFRPRFGGGRGPGNNSNRPPFSGGRHRHHGSFSSTPGNPPLPSGNNAGPQPPFMKREGSFGGRGGFPGRVGGDFRNEAPPFHDGPPPRDFRGGEGPPPVGRDFTPFRNSSDGPRGDFRTNASGDLPPFRPDEPPPSFRERGPEPPHRDFRDGPTPRDPAFGGPPPPHRLPIRDGPPFRPGNERGRSGSGRQPELGREGAFGSMAGGPPGREGSFGPRDMVGPLRGEPGRDASFGSRGVDIGGPPRDLARDGCFGPSMPPRDIGREAPFGPRGGDMGVPPRDLPRESSFGPRGGDTGGLPRDTGREGPFGLRGGDLGAAPRDEVRDVAFGPRGADVGGPPRGPGAPFSRGGVPPPREGGPPPPHAFHRGPESPRETTFSDLAGPTPPRDRPFRDETRVRSNGQGPPGTNPMGNLPSGPRRPTDPRRRSNQDLGGLASGPSHVPSDGPSDGPPLPSPQPGRRLGSYSSLADSSTMPPNLMPTQPLPMGHDGGPGSFRSPAGRRPLADPGRSDHYGSGGPQPPSRSPALEKRALNSSPRASDKVIKSPGFNSNAQGGSGNSGGIPPMAPSLSSRGPPSANFRDPRFKSNERTGDARPDFNTSASFGGLGGSRKKSFSVGADNPSVPADALARMRKDFGDRPSTQKSPRGSPSKATTMKTFPASPRNEVGKATVVFMPSDSSSGAQAEAQPSPKPEPLPPLLTSALGEGEIVERAETAMFHLSEVVGDKGLKAEGDDLSKLPAKQMIMSAVTEIEKLIKEAQKELDSCEEGKKNALKEEAKQEELENQRLAEEMARRVEEEKQKAEEDRRIQEKLKAEGLKKAMEDSREEFSQVRKTLEEECEQRIDKAKQDHKQLHEEALELQIFKAKENFDKDIAKARNFVEKAKSSVTRVESKLAAARSEHESLVKSVQRGDAQQQRKDSERTSCPTSSSSLVVQIIAENNRRAQEAQILGFSMTSENDYPSIEEQTSEESGGPKDPQFGKSCEEWSVFTKQVTGLSDALYSEPSEAPYYQQHERTHALLAPTVKEYIQHQKKLLVDEWTVLSEEYEIRKRLYEKQQKKLAKKAQRSSISVSRKSILAGDKETSGTGQGIDRGNILESSSRTSNNPYRRARRGNEVRSEYEQEQIIAEIAAKEAMERRITHGGSKITRQVSRVERVGSAPCAFAGFVSICSVLTDHPLRHL